MKDFNTYWKEKAQKRRKAWAAKAKRFAEQHTQLEEKEQAQVRLIRGLKDGSIKVEVERSKD